MTGTGSILIFGCIGFLLIEEVRHWWVCKKVGMLEINRPAAEAETGGGGGFDREKSNRGFCNFLGFIRFRPG